MGLVSFLAYFLIGSGPAIALFFHGLAKRPILILLFLSSAFFWLITIIVASLLCKPFLYWESNSFILALLLVVAVSLQEVSRVGFFRLNRLLEGVLEKLAVSRRKAGLTPLDRIEIALAGGLGHGVVHSVLFFLSLLAPAAGPATFYSSKCPHIPFFLISAVASLAFLLLHTFSMIVAFDAFSQESSGRQFIVPGFHLLASFITLLNHKGHCVTGLALLWICTLSLIVLCAQIVGQTLNLRVEFFQSHSSLQERGTRLVLR